jgi:hypothetical protein
MGTTFQIVQGAIRFRANSADQPTLKRWKSFVGPKNPSDDLKEDLQEKPVDAEGLLQMLQEEVGRVAPPPDGETAQAWLNQFNEPSLQMAGAVTLGEEGSADDLGSLSKLLSDANLLVRGAAVQGISRICERHGAPDDVSLLIRPLFDAELCVRASASACLIGHGWIQAWLDAAPSYRSNQYRYYLKQTVEEVIHATNLSKEEKERILDRLFQEGKPLAGFVRKVLEKMAEELGQQIVKYKESAQEVLRSPGGSVAAQIHLSQAGSLKQRLRFLRKTLTRLET